MPYVASIGTYLPCWGNPPRRVAGDDVVEVDDFFPGVDSIRYEDLGFAERFGAYGVEVVDAVTILEGPVADGG